MRWWGVLLVAGCGRFGFDAELAGDARSDGVAPDVAPDVAVPVQCLGDDFNDGDASDWIVIDPAWVVQGSVGPDASPAFVVPAPTGSSLVTHPALYGLVDVDVDIAFRIDSPGAGDFNLYFVEPGWTDPESSTTRHYDVGIHPTTGDTAEDYIGKFVAGNRMDLATAPLSTSSGTWYKLHVKRDPENAFLVELDDVLYMTSGPDPEIPGPLDLVVRFYDHGAIDNVKIVCTH